MRPPQQSRAAQSSFPFFPDNFNSPLEQINYQLCADEIGISKGGFENAFRAIVKKLKENNCYVGEVAVEPAGGSAEKGAKKAGIRKRKADTEGDEDGSKSSAKKCRKLSKTKATNKNDEGNVEDEADGNKFPAKKTLKPHATKVKAEAVEKNDYEGQEMGV
jgi:hypothetical protein